MSSNEFIRLNQVIRELNISLETAVDYLAIKGIEIEARPTTKISQETYKILLDGFQFDKNKKIAVNVISEKIRKEKEEIRLAFELSKKRMPEKTNNYSEESDIKKRRIIRKSDFNKSDEFILKPKNQIEKELREFWKIEKFEFKIGRASCRGTV